MEKLKNVGADFVSVQRKNKGITLVALIVSIIIMLILVGVSIQVVINSDLLGTTQDTGDKTEHATEREKLEVAVYEYTVQKYGANKTLAEFLKQNFGEQNVTENTADNVTVTLEDGERYKVWTDGRIKKVQRCKHIRNI